MTRLSSPPVPAYRNAAIRALSEKLEDARVRRTRLRETGIVTESLDLEILDLRRQLREGGQLLAGDALGDGRYLLVKPAGRGGFAVVWEAYDRLDSRTVAIKVLHSHLAGDLLRRERFFRGARVMMKLAGAAVVQVLDPEAEDGGFHYFVMEFLPGGNLSDAVLKGHLARENIFPLMLRVSDAVGKAHALGIIHRDVKPSNVLLDGEGNPKLTDFDLVGVPGTTGGTRTGALGTLLYAAPECLDKPQDATARADVYGLGMTAIFCLSGQELARSVLRDPERVIATLPCSERVKAELRRAVAWEPAERFADAAAWGNALRTALDAPRNDQEFEAGGGAGDLGSTAGDTKAQNRLEVHGDPPHRSPDSGSPSWREVEGVPSTDLSGRSYISVIGIDRYRGWPRLSNAVNDARGVLRVFERLGFMSVGEPLLDDRATGEAMHRHVTGDLAGLRPADSLVLFFAGHGHTITRDIGDTRVRSGYIIPVDGDYPTAMSSSWLRLDSWLSEISRLPPRHILVIVDACRSGVSVGSVLRWRSRGMATGYGDPLTYLAARRSRRIITSALDDQLAIDGGPVPGHSLFTGCLIEALTGGLFQSTGHSIVTGSEIGQYVQQRVASYPGSTQTPDWGALELDDRGEMLVRIAAADAERSPANEAAAGTEQGTARSPLDVAEGLARTSAPSPLHRAVRGYADTWRLVIVLIISAIIGSVLVVLILRT